MLISHPILKYYRQGHIFFTSILFRNGPSLSVEIELNY